MLQLRYYQKQAYDRFFEYTANNWGKNPIIVIPTAGGKSLLQAYIVKRILEDEGTRILLITHQKELIKQNSEELVKNFDSEIELDYGIYSAGLKSRNTQNRVLFAGIQSVYKKAWHLGWFDVILVDESHLIPHKGEGMYRRFLDDMKEINNNVIIAGLTATAYRLKDGLLTEGEGALFHDICHETTIKELINPDDFRNHDKKQYLCSLISKNGVNSADLSNVHIRGGEYIPQEMQAAFQTGDLVCRAVNEISNLTVGRKKILVFCAGIEHCEEVCNKMNLLNLNARFIHSKQDSKINDKNIQDFKDGKFRFLLNVGILTTGFNEKAIDCIVLLRSTKSPGLYYQMVGRALRMHPDKENCLILDFGGNIAYHGPIDGIEIRKNKKTGKSEVTTTMEKTCPECKVFLHLAVMECPECGYIFPQTEKHDDKASDKDIISTWHPPEEVEIKNVEYWRHTKKGKPDSLRVDYFVNMFEKYSTWICVEHEGFARKKALQWLDNVTEYPYDIETVSDALDVCSNFRKPSKIIVDKNGKFPNITGYIFETEEEAERKAIENLMF